MGFAKPARDGSLSSHLFVANCGPALDLSLPTIASVFAVFGPLAGVQLADATGCRVIVSYHTVAHAQAARVALHGVPCSALGNRTLFIQYSVPRPEPLVKEPLPVFASASETDIPGLFLFEDFVDKNMEQELLAAVDERPWELLSKRRVQHYGYEFQYKIRNVDIRQSMGPLPNFMDRVIEKISSLAELTEAEEGSLPLDQVTVNEYPPGVGLAPHIDTHSAFQGAIISLSLAGPCVMEFRKYETDIDTLEPERRAGKKQVEASWEGRWQAKCQDDDKTRRCPMQCRSIFLPERSLLVLSDEARYLWHHYIPHHKIDLVNGRTIQRKQRRVSFTFRKVRRGPCHCKYPHVCDSQALLCSRQPMDDLEMV